jgi:ADP-ribosylglycohydrolase
LAGWTSPYELLRDEFVQRADERCHIPVPLRERFDGLDRSADAWNLTLIDPIYDALMALPEGPGLARREPSDLESIRMLRPDGPRRLAFAPDEDELIDRMHGAWTGRCVGCALGKPVEIMGFQRDDQGRPDGRARIKRYLTLRDDWFLRDYFSGSDMKDEDELICPRSQRENIAYMEPDDDIHYSLIGLKVLEDHGFNFNWLDVAHTWMRCLPIRSICTAEQQAILNVQRHDSHQSGHDPALTARWTRRHRNPYREWIGAQIRSDGWAFCCAGRPERAAELAWRDAHWTHERNGIYGEMMFAAMQAAAFAEHDPRRIIEIGLSEIPAECRLALWVHKAIAWCEQTPDFEACMDQLDLELGDMNPVHTINNALVCVIALLTGGMDTTLTPTIAVMCGLDTDCNGASVGSIVGAASGRKQFSEHLASQLNDEVRPDMLGLQRITMHELAQRTAAVWRGIDS